MRSPGFLNSSFPILLLQSFFVAVLFAWILLSPLPLFAYVGPGAGFAVMTSFFAFFISFLLAFLSILFFPFRFIYRLWIRRKFTGNRLAKRVVIIGFDGMDFNLTRKWIDEGKIGRAHV
ncbi:MAG: hypothetical protein M1426_04490, partial [Patescibacteria group bacterium]|nr:hypothetical protein [Patescibacteria group bacterium]